MNKNNRQQQLTVRGSRLEVMAQDHGSRSRLTYTALAQIIRVLRSLLLTLLIYKLVPAARGHTHPLSLLLKARKMHGSEAAEWAAVSAAV